jgi:hypothetical protein
MANGKTGFPGWLKLLGLGVAGFFALMVGIIMLAVLVAGSKPSDTGLKDCQEQNDSLRSQIVALEKQLKNPVPEPTQEPAKLEEPDGSFGSGTMVVGKDIQPGRYKSAGATGSLCYYVRLKGFSGEMGDIISNELAQPDDGAVIVNIKKTDAGFQSKGCDRWSPMTETGK